MRVLSLAALALLCACKGSDSPGKSCIDLPADCTPSIPTTFDAIYSQVLLPSCGSSLTGGSCHAKAGAQAGLILEGQDVAYDMLLGNGGAKARVEPGMPECSVLMQRLSSDDASFRMPRGSAKLPDGVRCAISKWIEKGADK
jgi:hypothetical protein